MAEGEDGREQGQTWAWQLVSSEDGRDAIPLQKLTVVCRSSQDFTALASSPETWAIKAAWCVAESWPWTVD